MTIRGGPVVGSGGGGLAANYFSAGNKNVVDLSAGLSAAVALQVNNSEGPANFNIDADTFHLDCLTTGVYIVNISCAFTVTGVAASPVNNTRILLNFDDISDVNSLANWIEFEQDNLIDQSTSTIFVAFLTTPPVAIAAGDKFEVFAGLETATPMGVTVKLAHADNLTLTAARIA